MAISHRKQRSLHQRDCHASLAMTGCAKWVLMRLFLDLDPVGRLCAITIEHVSERTVIAGFSYAEITAASVESL